MQTTPRISRKSQQSEENAVARISNIAAGVLMPVMFILGLGVGYWLWGRPEVREQVASAAVATAQAGYQASAQSTQAAAPTAAKQQGAGEVDPSTIKRYPIVEDDDPSFGPANAPITIIEFSDYECPFCKKWHAEVLPRLQETYPGKIRLVYRDFPLYSIHANASSAAEAANCAGEQGRYWDYHTRLFAGSAAFSRSLFDKYAADLKLDAAKFKSCMDEHRTEKEVRADADYAAQVGIRSTPTFFINGVAIIGAQPFEVFKQVIDLELAGKIPKS